MLDVDPCEVSGSICGVLEVPPRLGAKVTDVKWLMENVDDCSTLPLGLLEAVELQNSIVTLIAAVAIWLSVTTGGVFGRTVVNELDAEKVLDLMTEVVERVVSVMTAKVGFTLEIISSCEVFIPEDVVRLVLDLEVELTVVCSASVGEVRIEDFETTSDLLLSAGVCFVSDA